MSQKPETLFKQWVRPRLESIPHSWWFKTQMIAFMGIPDFIGCVEGHFVAIELKKDRDSKPSKLQEWTLKKIKEAGGHTHIASPENWHIVYRDVLSLLSSI